ncbi:hypothetical protein [Shewanella psychrotolerans]|uniref:hypothetical protein n=1 Tax=Shewanella psychrotolerans TaxID=2864206 RepID=UPI001C6582FD|nr:hypothetical protein [Shewanella psychrotolerans]QYK00294.1 hypothetical protein K0I62_12845 [Shewanella psychrotolerans]
MSEQNLNITQGSAPAGHSFQLSQTPQPDKLIPVNIQFTELKDSIVLNKQTLTIDYQQASDRQLLKASADQPSSTVQLATQSITADELKGLLQVIGTTKTVDLPRTLLAYIKGNNISMAQLINLAERVQGYPIGEAKIINNLVSIPPSIQFRLPQGQVLDGSYSASLMSIKGDLQLALTPRLAQIPITLTGEQGQLERVISNDGIATSLTQKMSLVSGYGQLLHNLGKYSLTQQQLATLAKPLEAPTAFTLQTPQNLIPKQFLGLNSQRLQTSLTDTIISDPIIKQLSNRMVLSVPTESPPSVAQGRQAYRPETSQIAGLSQTLLFKMINNINTQALSTPITAALTTSLVTKIGLQQINMPTDTSQSLSNKLTLGSADVSASDTKAMHRGLNQALNLIADKSLPNADSGQLISKRSLLSLLQQIQPLAFPRPLGELATPTVLQQELVDSIAASIVSSSLPKLATSSHSSTIGILFQLLLGRQHQQSNTNQLNQYLNQLQQKLGMRSPLLNLLDKANTGDVMGKLISGLTLYQQASSDTTQATNWYFTLPYMLDSRQEELEGHFEQNKEADAKNQHWRLQLKFNLTLGAILINAEVNKNRLKLGFTSDSDKLLSQVSNKLTPLSQKISAIGLVTDNIVTHKAKVPGSLLPGEHYLVKIKA